MKHELYTRVALAVDIPEHNFKKGMLQQFVSISNRGKIPNLVWRWNFSTPSARPSMFFSFLNRLWNH